jgi:hypothetical protein
MTPQVVACFVPPRKARRRRLRHARLLVLAEFCGLRAVRYRCPFPMNGVIPSALFVVSMADGKSF